MFESRYRKLEQEDRLKREQLMEQKERESFQ